MILADTNVVIDFCGVTTERTRRAKRVRRAMEGERLVITEVVLAECFWVLRQSYGWPEEESAVVLADVASSREFLLEHGTLSRGLALKVAHPALDIADCLLAARALQGDTVITHDARLSQAIELELKGND